MADSKQAARQSSGSKTKTQKIQRETPLAWWCPICDHAQVPTIDQCLGCGAERQGDKVVPAKGGDHADR